MMTQTESFHTSRTTQPLRTVALVGRYAHHYLQETMRSAVGYDVVFVESTAHAYSKIKRVHPDLVILCLSNDDPDGCQVLSMLALDSDTSRIPVLTHFTTGFDGFDTDEADEDPDSFNHLNAISLN